MIELIYNEEGEMISEEKELCEPKNIRQIGEPSENKKIFIEDYVYTFLQQYSQQKKKRSEKTAVLLGTCEKSGYKKNLYIKSALAVENVEERAGRYEFTEQLWGKIYQECEKYFPGQEIVGWFLSCPGVPVERSSAAEETQKIYFPGADKIFMMFEPLEGEAGFFAFHQNYFERQSGYCIYYEKNEPMHRYILDLNFLETEKEDPESTERAVANFRRILQEKQEKNVERRKKFTGYAARAGVLVCLLAGGMFLYGQRKNMEFFEAMEVSVGGGQKKENHGEAVVVENLPGDVKEEVVMQEKDPDENQKLPEEEKQQDLPVSSEEAEEEPAADPEPEQTPEAENLEEQTAAAPVYEEYTVKQGDTLAGISRKRYGNAERIDEICQLNGIEDGDYIQEGEIILLP